MLDKWRKYSYVAQKERRHKVIKFVLWLFFVFASFTFVTTLFISTVVVENSTMKPGLLAGDRLFVSTISYGPYLPLFDARLPGPGTPQRGDLVLVDLRNQDTGKVKRFLSAFVRFFTAQRLDWEADPKAKRAVKRVIGVPGDVLSMTDYVFRVKAAGESYGLTEFELTPRPYDVNVPALPEGWSAAVPFSGTMSPVTLGAGEYFLVSDDRQATSDSRSWGPVPFKLIVGKVVFRYWPLGRFGRP